MTKALSILHSTLWKNTLFLFKEELPDWNIATKVRTSYGPLAYFSDIFISGRNDNILPEMKISEKYAIGL